MSGPVAPELSRPVPIGSVGPEGREVTVEATLSERALLASRFGLPAIMALRCRFRLLPLTEGGIAADGVLEARVRQICVVTSDEFDAEVAEAFALRFVPQSALSDAIDVDAPDEIPITGAQIDLGEATAEQLALALDPYPRRPDLPDRDDAAQPARISPFAVLKRSA